MSLLDRILKRNPAHISHKLKGAKRLHNESFRAFKKREKREHSLLKSYLKGDMVWCAIGYKKHQVGEMADGSPFYITVKDHTLSKGTYIKKYHGLLRTPRATV